MWYATVKTDVAERVILARCPLRETRSDVFETLISIRRILPSVVRRNERVEPYVGVVASELLLSRLAKSTLDWIKPRQQPALSVFGPGGIGKSALVARFVPEHARLPEDARIPFAYLDFDRPILDISKPLTLCLEMLRQLHLQFPIRGNFRPLLDFVTERIEPLCRQSQCRRGSGGKLIHAIARG